MWKKINLVFKPFECVEVVTQKLETTIYLGEGYLNVIRKVGIIPQDYHLRIEFDNRREVEFIEASKDSELDVEILWIEIFRVPVEEIIPILSANHEMLISEFGDCYDFPDLWLSLWRRFVPGLKKNAWHEPEDMNLGRYFDTCSIMTRAYMERRLYGTPEPKGLESKWTNILKPFSWWKPEP